MKDALEVVEDIVEYWNNFDDKEVDLFVNVVPLGEVKDIEDVIEAPPPTPDPRDGSGTTTEEEEDDFSSAVVGSRERRAGALDSARTPTEKTRASDMKVERRMADMGYSTISAQAREDRVEVERLNSELELLEERHAAAVEQGWDEEKMAGIGISTADVSAATREAETAERAAGDSQELLDRADTELKIISDIPTQGDPNAIYNTGALNLQDAFLSMLNTIQRDSEGTIIGNIGGFLGDLGVRVPDLLKGFPEFFTFLSDDTREKIVTGIGDHFKTLAENVPGNLEAIGEVFTSMPELAEGAMGPIEAAFEEAGMTIPEDYLSNISDWWSMDLPDGVREATEEVIGPIMLELGERAESDLEGTIGEFWDLLPADVKEIIEESITPTFLEAAEEMGLSIDEFMTKGFVDMEPEVVKIINEGIGGAFSEMSLDALKAIAVPGSRLAALGDDIPDELATNLTNVIRVGAEDAEIPIERLMAIIASVPEDGNIIQALESEFPDIVQRGADLAADHMDLIAEAGAEIPDDPSLIAAITGTQRGGMVALFGQGGKDSGDEFGSEAVSGIRSRLSAYQRTNPSVTVKVNYDTSGAPGNIGGLMTSKGFRRNLGGLIPFAKGGMAKYMAGGVVGGFGNYDNVPAILTPGEFVIRREAVEKYGRNFFADLNSTIYNKKPEFSKPEYGVSTPQYKEASKDAEKSQVMYNSNYQINVNVKSDSSPEQIARTVTDHIKKVDSQRIRGNRF
jgi:hypothetical protein